MQINAETIKRIAETVNKIESEIGKHIIGQKQLVRQTVICMLAGGNVLLEGLPGLGKTRLVKTIGAVTSLRFSRIQFTPDLMPADVIGTNIITTSESGNVLKFQPGPVFANIVLADEINRATPKTQSALLEAMQEQTVTVGTNTYKVPQPFFVLATQNPIEQEGTYPLPEAQLDRFLFKINVDFPTMDELSEIVTLTTGNKEDAPAAVTSAEEILEMRAISREVAVAKPVMDYILKLILATHKESEYAHPLAKKYLRYGSSPRGAQAILATARIRALLEGRYNVAYDDIENIALSALRHRIFLNFEAMSDGINADTLLKEIMTGIER